MISRVLMVAAVLAVGVASPLPEDCLQRVDPVACVQDHVVRSLRSLFGQESVDLLTEVPEDDDRGGRAVRAVEDGHDSSDFEAEDKNYLEAVAEGRGKKLKKLLPLLLLLKIPYFVYGVLAYVAVALVAKAALLKGTLALGLSGVFLLRKLLSHHSVFTTRHEVQVHGGGHGGAGGYSGGGGYDSYATAHADQHKQYAHNVAYKNQHRR